ncbi:MAG: [protein-PII] uridylyltransferase [Pseudomonadota bacterium]|nr:[protein-PII] uridylyltransferase [Pseudomonadota bacterium]
MDQLRNRRAIIDRIDLQERVEAILDGDLNEADRASEVLNIYRETLKSGIAEIRSRFDDTQDGELTVRGHCFLIDQLIRVIHDIAVTWFYKAANPTAADQLCIVAYGGYGRGELAPRSDIDLLFLLPYKATPRVEQIIEHVLYTLWDLGLKVGHATRSIDDCIRQAHDDMVIRTGLLESRYIWGVQTLHAELRMRFFEEVVKGKGLFVEAKLHERDERHERMGDSRYVLEPNIKDGKGGLRDLHTLFWIAKYLYRCESIAQLRDEGVFSSDELARFDKAQRFLWTVRCHLHYLTARAEERLTFDLQPELAREMGYVDREGVSGVERFMKHYFLVAKDVGDLTRIFCASLEARQQRSWTVKLPGLGLFTREVEDFKIEGGRLNVTSNKHFHDRPVEMLRLFEVAQRHELDIHPNALHLITRSLGRITKAVQQDPDANALFVRMLTSEKDPETTLRRLNEAGVFGKFVSDFGRVVAQMQYDMYHVYTTDEHTIRAIGILSRIERGLLNDDHPLASEIVHKVQSRDVLYASVLMHDIAKGRGGDHSKLGAEVARELCPRFGLSDEQTETVAWLVEYHLAMSNTAFKRDLSDPKTIADFSELVQSPERLRLLLCLTVVDIRAVGPGRWNGWKASLLRELYYRTEDVLTGGLAADRRDRAVTEAQENVRTALASWTDEAFEEFRALGPPGYWLAFETEDIARQAEFVREANRQNHQIAFDNRIDEYRAVTEITVYTADHPGLISSIAGGLAVSGVNIVDARINTLNDGMALDSFWIQGRENLAISQSTKLDSITANVEKAIASEIRLADELKKMKGLPSRMEVFTVAPRVLIDNKASNSRTVIEVNGRDRPGLLYDLTRALSDLGLQITSAKISTFGEEVVDVFYVKDIFGMKIEHEGKLKAIRQALLEALDNSIEAKPVAAE